MLLQGDAKTKLRPNKFDKSIATKIKSEKWENGKRAKFNEIKSRRARDPRGRSTRRDVSMDVRSVRTLQAFSSEEERKEKERKRKRVMLTSSRMLLAFSTPLLPPPSLTSPLRLNHDHRLPPFLCPPNSTTGIVCTRAKRGPTTKR